MNINFPPVDEHFIRHAVETGYYSNATELVRDAVRRMRETSFSRQSAFDHAIALGDADIAAGRVVEYTPEFLEDCVKRGLKNIANGLKPNPDVCA
jgi:antitoxin ParD1/3/4